MVGDERIMANINYLSVLIVMGTVSMIVGEIINSIAVLAFGIVMVIISLIMAIGVWVKELTEL